MAVNARLFMRQTWALTKKTLIIAVVRHWFSTALRALILPIAFLVLLLNIKNLIVGNNGFGVGSPAPIQSLADAVPSSKKLVLVQPPGLGPDVAAVVDRITASLRGKQFVYLTDPNDLVTTCRQSLHGDSDCFGAVVFNDSPLSNGGNFKSIWSYTLHTDNAKNGFGFHVNGHNNDQDTIFLPLQVAVENAMTNSTIVPNTYMFTTISQAQEDISVREQYQRLVISTYSIAFFISMLSPIYHVVSMITADRESGMTQLIDAMGGSSPARIMSYVLAFDILYLPCWITFGVLFWDELFRTSSVAISLFWQILVGWAITSAAVFSAMFFNKAQMSGIWSTVGFVIVALCGQLMDWGSPKTATVAVMSFLFPGMNYVFFMGYMCRYEEQGLQTDMLRATKTTRDEASTSRVPSLVLWLFLIIQIVIYPLLAILAERWTHGSKSKTRTVGISNDTQINSPAIKVSGLSKIYPPTFWKKWFTRGKNEDVIALENLDLVARNGQILCLLGANGSGKTTTLDLIGGLQRLTKGTIHISAAPSQIGVCPQRNVLWDELTVREHVQIWNKIKFSSEDNLAVENLIEACDLTAKTNARAKTLSGGQKRKLQLACTFIGGSSVCLLDEVTSGLDPVSRRIIWDILLAERAKRTLILTTHFLDEADVLADQVMIISKGRVKCEGSTVELKTRLGGGYKVHLEGVNAGPDMDFPSHYQQNETVYSTPDSASATRLLSNLENERSGEVFVNGPTIEEVFLRVAEEPHVPVDGEPIGKVRTMADELKQVRSNTAPEWDNMLSSGIEIGFFQQVRVLFHKRCIIILRNWWPYLIALAMPLAVTPNLKSFLMFYKIPSCLDLTADVHFLEQFNFAFGRRAIYPWNHVLVGPPSLNSSLFNALSSFSVGLGVDFKNYTNEFTFMNSLNDFQDYMMKNQSLVSPGALFMESNTSAPTYAYVGDFGIEAALLMQNLLSQVQSGIQIEGSFSFFNSLISPTAGNSLEFLAYFCLAQAVYPALFALYPTYEKTRHVRAIQYSNGIRALPLWTAYVLFDFMFVLFISVVCIAVIAVQAPHWFAVSYMFPVLALYGLSSMLMAYCFSLIARSQLAAFAWAAGVQCIIFIISIMAFVLIEAFSSTAHLLVALDGSTFGLNLLFPIANLVRATLVGLNVYIVDCRDGRFVRSPASIYAYGGPILYLCLQICFLFWLLNWLESRHSRKHTFHFHLPHKSIIGSDEEGNIEKVAEKEVLAEEKRVKDSEDDLLRVINVSKTFGTTKAVDNVSLGISSGEILALLGPNGAGKSTIINMIRGDLALDGGQILLQRIDMQKQTRMGQRHIGYCPQFDALDIMTVREHLTFYACAKGIQTVSADIELLMKNIGLQAYENRLASKLSGGNKRKLSLAIALLGNPSLLLLDEPTSSIDASSKRNLWKILLQLNNNSQAPNQPPHRSVLLTTHSMEEASHLASRAAILSKRILALGSIKGLRMRWGDLYHVHLVLKTAPESKKEEMVAVDEWVRGMFEECVVDGWGCVGGQVRFSVPARLSEEARVEETEVEALDSISVIRGGRNGGNCKGKETQKGGVAELFRRLEESKEELGLAFYSVRPTSMDEVFLNVVRENNVRD